MTLHTILQVVIHNAVVPCLIVHPLIDFGWGGNFNSSIMTRPPVAGVKALVSISSSSSPYTWPAALSTCRSSNGVTLDPSLSSPAVSSPSLPIWTVDYTTTQYYLTGNDCKLKELVYNIGMRKDIYIIFHSRLSDNELISHNVCIYTWIIII